VKVELNRVIVVWELGRDK